MKNNAYPYLPAALIIFLLAVSAYLLHITSDYKDLNRKLILENDSLLSVNYKLNNVAAEPGNRDQLRADRNKYAGEAGDDSGASDLARGN